MSRTHPSFRVGALLAGVAVDLAATFTAVASLGASLGVLLVARGAPPFAIQPAVEAWVAVPPGQVLILASGSLATMLGAWVAARMAPDTPLRHALAVGLASVALGLLFSGGASGIGPLEMVGMALALGVSVLAGTFVAPPPAPGSPPDAPVAAPVPAAPAAFPVVADAAPGVDARRRAARGAGAAIAAALAFAGVHLTTAASVGPWLPAVASEQPAPSPAPLDAEAILHAQPRRVAARLAELAPPRDGVPDLYLVAFGADATQSVFLSEVERVQALFDARFDTAGRSLVLANHRDALDRHPLASASNLRDVLRHLGATLDPEEDVLFLFLTGHGRRDPHELVVRFPSLPLNPLSPATLAGLLAEAGVGPRVLVVSACYSGGFVEPLADEEAVVVTASAAGRRSFGCRDGAEWTDYGRALFADALPTTFSLPQAFEEARRLVAVREAELGRPASRPQIAAGEVALARLEALRTRWLARAEAAVRAEGGARAWTRSGARGR